MITRFTNVRRIDPTQADSGELTDLVIEDERIVSTNLGQCVPNRTIDMDGCYVLAGGIDLHTHIGGGKVNLARLLMQDYLNDVKDSERGPLWSTEVTGQKYASMGYTACFEPAMLLPQARATHLQLADTPHLDSGAYVVMGNEDWLLRALGRGLEAKLLQELVRWTVSASRALAVKVVNAGGIDAFKYHQQALDVDQPHRLHGVTPRTVIRELSAAVDEIGLAHPLHVHASNLGVPGNIHATLATLDAAEGRRLHLTHAQFNCYTDSGPYQMGSGSTLLAERINRSPELSLDVGQIVFGQTVTLSADAAAQFRNSRHARPAKSIISDVECVGGCGIVPMRYESRQYVSSLQWTIGLELLLLIRNPYQVLLTTDHPNGGPFTSYPHLIRLLMDRSFRQQMISRLHPLVAEQCLLKELDREYTLDEIAILTRAAPATLLGLSQRGHLRPGGLADLVFYQPLADWEATFSTAHSLWKSGHEIIRAGQVVAHAPQQRIWAEHCRDASLPAAFRDAIEQTVRLPAAALELQDDEFAEPVKSWLDRAGAL